MTYFLIAFALSAGLLLWFRLIPVRLGLMLLGMFLLVLFSKWIYFYLSYIPTTRFHRAQPLLVLALIAAFVLTSILPSLAEAWDEQKQAMAKPDLEAFGWISQHTAADAVIVAAVDEGHRIAALGQRKNVIDNHFLLKPDAKQRLHDVNRILTTTFEVEAIGLMERYGASVILLSPETKRSLKVNTLVYGHPSRCFARTFDKDGYEIFIKHPFCKVEEI